MDAPSSPTRRLGPFSGAQLTVIVVAALLAFALPAGALAAGKLTKVTVKGPVTAQVAPTSAFYHRQSNMLITGGGCQMIAKPPTGKQLVVQEVTLNIVYLMTPDQSNSITLYIGTDCTGDRLANVTPSSLGPIALPFDPGVVVPASAKLSVEVSGDVGAESWVTGYLIPQKK